MTPVKFKELSYANETDPLLKRLVIRSIENLSGRSKYVEVYKVWRNEVVGKSDRVFSRMLELIDIDLSVRGNWPPKDLPEGPIVMNRCPSRRGPGRSPCPLAPAWSARRP